MLETNQSLKGLAIWDLGEDDAFPPVFSALASRGPERPIALKLVAVERLDLKLDDLIQSGRLSANWHFIGSKVDIDMCLTRLPIGVAVA